MSIKEKVYSFLRWSEKYTKTDMLYLTQGMSWLTLGQLVSAGTSFVLALAFANFLAKEAYGTYKFVLSLSALLTIPTLRGLGTAVTRTVAQGYDSSLLIAIKARIKWSSLSFIGGIIAALYYYLQGNSILALAMGIVGLFTPLIEIFTLYAAYLSGKKNFKTSSQYFITTQLIYATTVLVTLLFTENILIILMSYFLSLSITQGYFFFKIKKSIPETEMSTDVVSYGKHLSLMEVVGIIANHLDKILLFHFLGAAEVAIYFFAMAIPDQMKGMVKSLASLTLPKFAEKSPHEIKNGIKHKSFIFFILILIGIVAYVIAAPFIYNTFFPQYTSAIFFSQVYILSAFALLNIFPITALQAIGNKTNLYWSNILSSIVGIILLLTFIPLYGILGAVIAQVSTRIFAIGIYHFFWYRT